MRLDVSPQLEALINKRLSTGDYADVEDVLRRALEAQDAGEDWSGLELAEWNSHIEAGYQESLRGEIVDSEQAKREIQAAKASWLQARR